MSESQEEHGSWDDHHYPDSVLKSYCGGCGGRFYPRHTADYCPYCGDDRVYSEGNGVVNHRPEQSEADTDGE